jgi:23S rRNA (cytosine1962-C5)-methyltransferase
MNQFAKIILKHGKDKSVQRYHLWLFSGAIKMKDDNLKEGDVVEVYSEDGNYLATGHYQIGSITVRIFSFNKTNADRDFWKNKFLNAYSLRKRIGLVDNPGTNVYRLINAEGDGFPGLIIDYYNGTLVFQAHSIGMYLQRELFTEILQEIYNDRQISVYDKSEETLPAKAKIERKNAYILNPKAGLIEVCENGIKYYIDIEEGQKTGFFIDQRDNRELACKYAKDSTVLNAFSYTGGFSLAALKGGAKLVHSVDSSQKAITLLNKNIELNSSSDSQFSILNSQFLKRHESFSEDVFKFMSSMNNDYDLIILDPPAFGKHIDVLDNALKGYRNLNKKAMEKIKPGGILFTFSCSQIVSKTDFRNTIFSAAAMAKRRLRILHQLVQPADHPVNIYHPEGEYLKGLVLQVE